jgi:hypothetical protein
MSVGTGYHENLQCILHREVILILSIASFMSSFYRGVQAGVTCGRHRVLERSALCTVGRQCTLKGRETRVHELIGRSGLSSFHG